MAFVSENLDVSLYFDLDNNQYRIQDNSPYVDASPAIAESDIRGVYSLTDPNSNVLHENADYDNPDVATSIDADLYSAYESFTVADGVYTLVYNAKDVDTSTIYTKTFTFTYVSTLIPTVSIDIESNVGLATIESNDDTSYGATVTINSRSHVLTYPGSWGSSSTTGAQIALTDLYTGQYSTTITSDITITGTDNLIIYKDITGTQTHDVWDSDGMYALRVPLATFFDRWIAAQTADPKEGRRLEDLWTEINANYTLYNSAKQNGDLDTASTYVNNIKVILAAEDIDTTVDPSESVPVTSSLPGYATQWLNDSGVPADSLGRNNDYYIDDDTGIYYKKVSGSYVPQGSIGSYSFSVTSGTVAIPTDADGNNQDYTNASTDIVVYKAATDDTANWSFAKTSVSNADGTVTDNTLDITSITADTGYVQVTGSKTGASDVIITIYVKKIKDGAAVVDITSVDDVTIGINGSSKAYVKDDGITKEKINSDVVGETMIQHSDRSIDVSSLKTNFILYGTELNIPGISGAGMCSLSVNSIAFYDQTAKTLSTYELYRGAWTKIGNSYDVSVDMPTVGSVGGAGLALLDTDTIAFLHNNTNASGGIAYLVTYEWDGTDWSLVGNKFAYGTSFILEDIYITALNSSSIAVAGKIDPDLNTSIRTYSWDGTDWTTVGNVYDWGSTSHGISISTLTSSTIAVYDAISGLQTYSWDGTDWTTVGNKLSLSFASSQSCIDSVSQYGIIGYNTQEDLIKGYDFDGTDWTELTGDYYLVCGDTWPRINVLSGGIIVFFADSGDEDIISLLRIKSV